MRRAAWLGIGEIHLWNIGDAGFPKGRHESVPVVDMAAIDCRDGRDCLGVLDDLEGTAMTERRRYNGLELLLGIPAIAWHDYRVFRRGIYRFGRWRAMRRTIEVIILTFRYYRIAGIFPCYPRVK